MGPVFWRGVQTLKTPNDLISEAEIVFETEPDWIVETGTSQGGSALFYAELGVNVVSVDVAPQKPPPQHERITYLRGWSTDFRVLHQIRSLISGRVMVVLDSDHDKNTVLDELHAYAGFVTPGCYLIVEDTSLGGPAEALAEWLPDHPEFAPDPYRERFGYTEHAGGYLFRS